LFLSVCVHPEPASPYPRAGGFSVRTDSLVVAAVGDIMAHDSQIAAAWSAKKGGYDFNSVFTYVQDYLSTPDLAIGNFETTLPGEGSRYTGYPSFGAPDALAEALKNAGFDLLNTANNHCADRGRRGMVHTLDVLDRLGILHAGTYRNEAEYERDRVLWIDRNGIRIAVVAYTYGVNGEFPKGCVVSVADTVRMAADMRQARSGDPDFIIALMHFGTEYRLEPDASQIRLVDFLFREGADVVLGGHPHVLQKFETRNVTDRFGAARDRLVVYSLGNFLSNQRKPYRDGGMIFSFTLKRTMTETGRRTAGIGGIRSIPLWVFDRYRDASNRFLIVPVEPYLANYQPFDMPEASLRQMRFFLEDFNNRMRR
jgi:poly-gamma-glutamate synthesis protein (capsule biosynthesis protein)